MISLQVTPSGTVGKQVFNVASATTKTSKVRVEGLTLTPSGANAFIKIRDGNASGEVVLFAKALSAQGSKSLPEFEHVFTKGMHVAVVGALAQAYLYIE